MTEQVPATRVHVEELNAPLLLLLKVTVPEGVTGAPTSVSLTRAVHVVGAFTGTDAGTQLTVVEVDRWVAVREKFPELVKWSMSPL